MITAKELAEIVGGEICGDTDVNIECIRPPADVIENCVVYMEKPGDITNMGNRKPTAIICSIAAKLEEAAPALIRCKNTRLAFALAMRHFYPQEIFEGGVHPSAVVEDGAIVFPSANIGANCFVGAGSSIGEGSILLAGCCVGRNVTVGENCLLHPNVSVLDRCKFGNRVILHSGVVIGADGFGFANDDGIHIKVPQIGNAVIEDDVEIGANSAVDRATMGTTRIERGTKIDNLVQVGHNCNIGENCIICGAVGISGSCEIGDNTILAGQVGISDHVKIGENVVLGGRSGVYEDVPAKSFYSGFPARPHRHTMKIFSAMDKLPELIKKIENLDDKK